ncbi:MAG: DUF2207 domain-containing protein [bacterium]|nr:DUF2207 domain-containing protein [bacterium]
MPWRFFINVLGVIAGFSFIHAAYAGGVIEDFSTTMRVQRDATVAVDEYITYNFGPGDWHGIIRDLPVRFEARGKYREQSFDILEIVDETGAPYVVKTELTDAVLRIVIGDPDVSVSGVKIYIIRYIASGAIRSAEDQADLYWRVTGNDWTVPITRASARVILPEAAPAGLVYPACAIGFFSEAQACGRAEVSALEGKADTLRYAHENLAVGEGLIITAAFPGDLVVQPPFMMRVRKFIERHWLYALGVTWVLVGLVVWRTRRK